MELYMNQRQLFIKVVISWNGMLSNMNVWLLEFRKL